MPFKFDSSMAAFQLSGSVVTGKVPSFNGLRLSKTTFAAPSSVGASGLGIVQRSYRGFVVKAATVVSPKEREKLSIQSYGMLVLDLLCLCLQLAALWSIPLKVIVNR
ncbi:uncharacterized protein A4U43_C08F35110 [Asparagus officinalis]|nr:uncharacterized protein A4U43_C08F35110 [Asparagus officinalis]